jgi:teichuronic acid exporter
MNLREKVLSGIFWIGGARLVGQVLTWSVTIVVIRLLSPGEYGLLAMATVFMSILLMLAEAGLGAALIQAREVDELTLRRIFGAAIVIHLVLFVLQFAAAPLIAAFFKEERLVAIIRVLALQLLLMIFGVIPGALLSRNFKFKGASLIGLGSSVCGSLCTLALALAGYGVWALVAGSLIALLCSTVAINILAPFLRWPDFSLQGIRKLVLFGGQLTGARMLWLLYSQADVFIAGKLLGKELLGFYSVAMHLASLPVQKISSVFNQVALSAFAHAQHQPETVPLHMLKGIRMLSLLSFPVLWGISSIAPEFVMVFLGSKWMPAVESMRLLPLVMPLTMLSPFLNTAFQGIGRGGVVFMNTLTASVILPGAFWVGSNWGLFGLCVAWLIGFPLVFLVNLHRMLPLVGLKLSAVLAAIALPALASAGMYACVSLARQVWVATVAPPVLMVILITVGATGFAIITLAINRKGIREAMDLFQRRPSNGKSGL